jgi:6-phosphogluconate dehydrogenase
MPGGARPAYDHLRPILAPIAAKTDSGPCVTYVGPDGAGHFVKMVHNSIEYGVMQLIAEAYDLLHRALGLHSAQTAALFAEWNRGPLESYLIEIASQVLAVRDPETGNPLVEMTLDQAGQKGTGKWTAQAALDLGVPVPTIAAAIDARVLSSMKAERVRASKPLARVATPRVAGDTHELVDAVRDALDAATVCAYAQGLALLRAASAEYNWNVELREIARIWKGGCIIRARLLDPIMQAFERDPELPNLLLDADIRPGVLAAEHAWRLTVRTAVDHAIPACTVSHARLFRQLSLRRAAAESHPGPARFLRRPHVSARRSARSGFCAHGLAGADRIDRDQGRTVTAGALRHGEAWCPQRPDNRSRLLELESGAIAPTGHGLHPGIQRDR